MRLQQKRAETDFACEFFSAFIRHQHLRIISHCVNRFPTKKKDIQPTKHTQDDDMPNTLKYSLNERAGMQTLAQAEQISNDK